MPLLDGGGTRLKILEAFAAKRAVVSTSKGAEGIEAVPGSEILIADDPMIFADEIIRLLDHPDQAAEIGHAGYELAVSRYDWKSIGKQILTIYHSLDKPTPTMKTTKRTSKRASKQPTNTRFSMTKINTSTKVNG